MDIIAEWNHLAGQNAGVIMAWTTDFLRQYWKLTEDERPGPERKAILDEYRQRCFRGNYDNLIFQSHELIHVETGIDLPYLAVDLQVPRESDDM
jgi:hypothetical protein